jgi:hypothetical protein
MGSRDEVAVRERGDAGSSRWRMAAGRGAANYELATSDATQAHSRPTKRRRSVHLRAQAMGPWRGGHRSIRAAARRLGIPIPQSRTRRSYAARPATRASGSSVLQPRGAGARAVCIRGWSVLALRK